MSQVVFHPQKLADFISLKRGHDLPESQRLPGEIPVVSSAGITGFHNEAKCEGPGVVTGRYGTLGELHYIEGSYWPLNTTLYVDDFKGNDPRFVYYFLQTLDLAQFNGAGAVPGLNRNALAMIDVAVPKPDDQKVIAEQLTSFDLLADNLTQQIKILEDAARLIYTEWFIRQTLPHSTNWTPATLEEIVGINPKTPIETGKVAPFVPMTALSQTNMVIEGVELRALGGGAKFQNGDTLLARITPCLENGKTGFVQFLDDENPVASGSTEFIVLRSRRVNPYWVYCLSRTEHFREFAIRSMSGADGRQRVSTESLAQYPVTIPPAEVLEDFEKTVGPMFEQIHTLTQQIAQLRQARDLLLPRLISGQLRL